MTLTLHTVSNVAYEAEVTRQTIYTWLNACVITHKYNVDGRPVFTDEERAHIVAFAEKRLQLRSVVRLSA